ncbi:MAG: phosphate-starvation-inducible PsiE family protein [bacterium]|nr:phosphate-starvation-inducible PsiE family protein [bacterium]
MKKMITGKTRKLLLAIDDIIHVIIAIFLVVAAFLILYKAGANLLQPNVQSILLMISDIFFVLIIMELLWMIIRYLKRLAFSLRPFIFVGIISSIRGMLMIEAKMALGLQEEGSHYLFKLGTSVGIVLVLIVCLWILSKIQHPMNTDE